MGRGHWNNLGGDLGWLSFTVGPRPGAGDDWAQGLPTTPDEEHLARPGGAESCPLK